MNAHPQAFGQKRAKKPGWVKHAGTTLCTTKGCVSRQAFRNRDEQAACTIVNRAIYNLLAPGDLGTYLEFLLRGGVR